MSLASRRLGLEPFDIENRIDSTLNELKELEQVLQRFRRRNFRNQMEEDAKYWVAKEMDDLIGCIREISGNKKNDNSSVHDYCQQVISTAKAVLQDPNRLNISSLELLASEASMPRNLSTSNCQKLNKAMVGIAVAIAASLLVVAIAALCISSPLYGLAFFALADEGIYRFFSDGYSIVKEKLNYLSFFGGNGARTEMTNKINTISTLCKMLSP